MTGIVRAARADDAEAIAAIYAPYVTDSVVTFEDVPPDATEMADRIAGTMRSHPWLVAETDGAIAGYTYVRPFHSRPGYRWTTETSIYLAADAHRRGIGLSLYTRPLDTLVAQGMGAAIAVITLPGTASTGFHTRLGFREAGRLPRNGWKHGRWHDVGYLVRDLAPRDGAPAGTTTPATG